MSPMIIILAASSAISGLDPAWIAFLGAAFGGAGLKVTEAWLGRNKLRNDDASQIRDELRQEITSQREEIRQLEIDVHKWREEYYTLRDKYMTLQLELLQKVESMKQEFSGGDRVVPTPVVPPLNPLTGPDKV